MTSYKNGGKEEGGLECTETAPLNDQTVELEYREALLNWAHDGKRLREEPLELMYALCSFLNEELDIDIGLASIVIRTPHPQLDMLVMRWRPLNTTEVPTSTTNLIIGKETTKREDGVLDIYPLARGHTNEAMYLSSPFYCVLNSESSIRVSLVPPPNPVPYPIIADLIERGMTDYAAFPLTSTSGVSAALSFSTLREGGFPTNFLQAFESVTDALSLSIAYKTERIQFREVLAAYIGGDPALRVLGGQIRPGDSVSRESAIGFADLRDFTYASTILKKDAFLSLLGNYFQLVCKAVSSVDGEILKFIGDGVLFIIPNHGGDKRSTCDKALEAFRRLNKSVQEHNQSIPDASTENANTNTNTNTANTRSPIQFRCALHYGSALYGNIGSPTRLDFTIMGPAVNLTARLESLSGTIDEQCLISKQFAGLTSWPMRFVGHYNLKGFVDTQEVFAPENIEVCYFGKDNKKSFAIENKKMGRHNNNEEQ